MKKGKLDKKELRKMANKCMEQEIYVLPDVFFQSELIRKIIVRCYEIGYRYGEHSNNKLK